MGERTRQWQGYGPWSWRRSRDGKARRFCASGRFFTASSITERFEGKRCVENAGSGSNESTSRHRRRIPPYARDASLSVYAERRENAVEAAGRGKQVCGTGGDNRQRAVRVLRALRRRLHAKCDLPQWRRHNRFEQMHRLRFMRERMSKPGDFAFRENINYLFERSRLPPPQTNR